MTILVTDAVKFGTFLKSVACYKLFGYDAICFSFADASNNGGDIHNGTQGF